MFWNNPLHPGSSRVTDSLPLDSLLKDLTETHLYIAKFSFRFSCYAHESIGQFL